MLLLLKYAFAFLVSPYTPKGLEKNCPSMCSWEVRKSLMPSEGTDTQPQ